MIFTYVKDSFVPKEQASVSIEDRGFRFGDGIFETIRIHNFIPYQWELHFNRLMEGLQALKIEAGTENLHHLSKELIEKNNAKEGFLRIAITRGVGSAGYLPMLPMQKGNATIVIETMPDGYVPIEPVDLWLSSLQKISSRSLPVHTKIAQGGNMILSRMEAAENNCFESLLLGDRTQICEGSSSNIFWYQGNTLFTPSLRSGILPGTIRDAIMRISPVKVKEGLFLLKDLLTAEEVFLTNVAWQILPVKALHPMEKTWDSFEICRLLKGLLDQDITSYAAARQPTASS